MGHWHAMYYYEVMCIPYNGKLLQGLKFAIFAIQPNLCPLTVHNVLLCHPCQWRNSLRYVQSLSPYSMTLRYCLHLIGQFVFFRNGTRNLKSTLVRTHVCMVVSFVDIRTVLKVMHMYIMFLFSAGLCDYLLFLHTFLL